MRLINLRPAVERHLRQRMEAFRDGFRHNLALIGPPRSGKTFQLQQVLAQPPEGMFFIYAPLYHESSHALLTRLLQAILGAAVGGPAEQLLEDRLRMARERSARMAPALAAIEGLLSRRLVGDALTRALDLIPILVEERGQPCVLILDEFLCLESSGVSHVFHELGKRVMTWPTVLFVLCSSSPFLARAILRERLQLLFGQFELLELEALQDPPMVAWLRQELRGLRGAATLSLFLVDWMGTSPWYLTVFLARLKELAVLQRAAEVTPALFLQAAWDVLGNAEGALHQWCVSRTTPLGRNQVTGRCLEVLAQIAGGARTTTELGKRVGRAGLAVALQLLQEHDLAQRNGTCWVIPDPLLRCWLATGLWTQRGDPSLASPEARRRFEQSLEGLWDRWVRARQLSFCEQMADLFARFREETVSLDHKIGRLPAFSAIRTEVREPSAGVYLIAEGPGKHWCCSIVEQPVTEPAIAAFEEFCRDQSPKPSRKVVIAPAGLDANARVLAKAASMWVWEQRELDVLLGLYSQQPMPG